MDGENTSRVVPVSKYLLTACDMIASNIDVKGKRLTGRS